MPRIVDHEKYKRELAGRAVSLFRQHGFHGVDMRSVAHHLGISKSALYHYFPTKQDLFRTCAGVITDFPETDLSSEDTGERIESLINFCRELEPDFPGELRIILDVMGTEEINGNGEEPEPGSLRDTLARYGKYIKELAGGRRERILLPFLLGTLLVRSIDPGVLEWDEIRQQLRQILDN